MSGFRLDGTHVSGAISIASRRSSQPNSHHVSALESSKEVVRCAFEVLGPVTDSASSRCFSFREADTSHLVVKGTFVRADRVKRELVD